MGELGCVCPCDLHFDDPPKLCKEKKVRALKTHTCCECAQLISKGEEYHRISILDQGWSRFQVCASCMAIARDLAGGCWPVGELREHIEWCLGFDYLLTGPDDKGDGLK
jgi:hypothetical protein